MNTNVNPTYTHRTRDGRLARIICTDLKNDKYPVLALIDCNGEEEVERYTESLRYYSADLESADDLFEISPWDEVKVDTPVWIRNACNELEPYHFAKFENGTVYLWWAGTTSHSCKGSLVRTIGRQPHEVHITRPEGM